MTDLLTEVKTYAATATNFVKDNLGIIGAGVGGAALGGVLGYVAGTKNSVSSKSKRATSKRRKGKHHSRKKGRRYTPHTAGKRKDTSHKRIRQTKNGQPYIILASGKAKFISRASARRSRKTSGGRY
jgi:hypothetical protein